MRLTVIPIVNGALIRVRKDLERGRDESKIRTIFSVLSDFNNVVVQMVTACSLIYMSYCPFVKNFGDWTKQTNYNSYHRQLHVPLIFFSSLANSRCSSLFWFTRQILFLLLTISRSSRLAEFRWSVCISKSKKILCVSFSRMDSGFCIYHLFLWSNFNFSRNS